MQDKPIITEEDFELSEDDLDELDDTINSTTSYEVWALGIDKFDNVTDYEVLLGSFEDPEEAKTFVWTVDKDLIKTKTSKEFPANLKQINIEVETVVDNGDYTENVGTIFRTDLVI